MEESSTRPSSFMICELETTVVTMVKAFTLTLVKARGSRWSSPPVYGDYTTAENRLCKICYQLISFLTISFRDLGYDARRASSLAAFHLADCFADLGRRHTGSGAGSWGDLKELITWPFIFNIEGPRIVLCPCLHIVPISERKLTRISQQCSSLHGLVCRYRKHNHNLEIL